MSKDVVVVAGPTASGKSALAIDLAVAINGVIVNCDSMQIYKKLPIITACPSAEDKAKVEHRLFEIYDCAVRGNVVEWLDLAVAEVKKIWAEGKTPVIVGGTGLYIDNLINGTTPIPETSAKVRKEVAQLIAEKGGQELYNKLKEVDAESAEKLSPNDISRVCRAYEVWKNTGILLSQWHKRPMIKRLPEADFFVIKICPSAQELDERCYQRFDMMMRRGVLAEIEHLAAQNLDQSLPAMKALGVPELLGFVKGDSSLEDAVAQAKLHTRQYAKRQRTWFKNKLQSDVEIAHCYQGKASDKEAVLQKFYQKKL